MSLINAPVHCKLQVCSRRSDSRLIICLFITKLVLCNCILHVACIINAFVIVIVIVNLLVNLNGGWNIPVPWLPTEDRMIA